MQLSDFNNRQQVSAAVRRQADRLLASLRAGQKVFSRLENGYLKMNAGPFWRLLSKDGGQQWWLMDHKTYNREIRK